MPCFLALNWSQSQTLERPISINLPYMFSVFEDFLGNYESPGVMETQKIKI